MGLVELSLCLNPDQNAALLADLLKTASLSSLRNVQVSVRPILWEDYKSELTGMALNSRGSDVSQVGFPLTDDLVAMNALMPVSPQLLAQVGGESAFHPTIWKIARRHPDELLWGLPWLVDPRAIFYWKDLLEEAQIDAETAFQTSEAMEAACVRLQEMGIAAPWVLGTADKFVIIHSVVSWVWGKGGDFFSPAGDKVFFTEKPALDGLEAYFRLQRYMPESGHPLSVADAQHLFVERKAAITLGPYGSLRSFLAAVPQEVRGQLGVALPPGPPLIAGSDLVFWRHSRKDVDVLKLFSALFSTDVQVGYTEYLGDLPVTRGALAHLAQSPDPNVRTFIGTLDQGRVFATTKFAGMLEIQLGSILAGLWAELAEKPADNLRAAIQKSLEPVQRRFDLLQNR